VRDYDPRVSARQQLSDQVNAPVGLAEAEREVCPKCGAGKRRRCTYVARGRRKGQPMRGRVHSERKQAVRSRRKAELLQLSAWLAEHGHLLVNADKAESA
jgi:hypothetical protein